MQAVTGGEAVKRHADFMEEFRSDPTVVINFLLRGCRRLCFSQTAKMTTKAAGSISIWVVKSCLQKMGLRSGDLLVWRYNLKHGVKDVAVDQQKLWISEGHLPEL